MRKARGNARRRRVQEGSHVADWQHQRLASMHDERCPYRRRALQSQAVEIFCRLDDAFDQVAAHAAWVAQLVPFVAIAAAQVAQLRQLDDPVDGSALGRGWLLAAHGDSLLVAGPSKTGRRAAGVIRLRREQRRPDRAGRPPARLRDSQAARALPERPGGAHATARVRQRRYHFQNPACAASGRFSTRGGLRSPHIGPMITSPQGGVPPSAVSMRV